MRTDFAAGETGDSLGFFNYKYRHGKGYRDATDDTIGIITVSVARFQ